MIISSIVPIFILGQLNTGVGCYFYFSSIGYLPVQTVAICGYLEPLSLIRIFVSLTSKSLPSIDQYHNGLDRVCIKLVFHHFIHCLKLKHTVQTHMVFIYV